jgi:hypothetical protein
LVLEFKLRALVEEWNKGWAPGVNPEWGSRGFRGFGPLLVADIL